MPLLDEFESMDEALLGLLQMVLNHGIHSEPRGLKTKEVLGAGFTLLNPRARLILNPIRRWNVRLALGELTWHLAASDSASFVAHYARRWREFSDDGVRISGSCYGKKIFGRGRNKPSQWERVKSLLRSDPHSRQAVISLYNGAEALGTETLDIACTTNLQYLIRDQKLHAITYMRSNDLIWGTCYDCFVFTFLQELLAVELGLELGAYHHFAGSLHLYSRHYDLAHRLIESEVPPFSRPMVPITDPSMVRAFLSAEHALRINSPAANQRVSNLPPFWRKLLTVMEPSASGDSYGFAELLQDEDGR